MSKRLCIHGCGRVLSENSRLEECPPCRSGYRYWKKKRPEERITRRHQLDILSSRLDTHFDTSGETNVKLLQQPKTKRTGRKVVLQRERRIGA